MGMLNRIRESYWKLGDNFIHSILISMIEGRDSNNHLIDQDTNAPPIYRLVMPFGGYDLGCQVLGRTTK